MSAHEELCERIRLWVRTHPGEIVSIVGGSDPIAFIVSQDALAHLSVLMQAEYDRIEREILYGTGGPAPLGLLNVTGFLPVQASLATRQHVARVLNVPLADPEQE